MPSSLLQLTHICKSFPGVRVLDQLSFDLKAGEVHSLCGENGAGKSTLIKILAGVHAHDSGDIQINGHPIQISHPQAAKQLGISTIYQENSLFQNLSIVENIFAGQEYRKGRIFCDHDAMTAKAQDMLTQFGLHVSPRQHASTLGAAEQKIIEVIRALIMDAKILILDEPTASFGKEETRLLLDVVQQVKAKGMGIIYISHHLEEVFEISDRITILRDGKVINTYTAGQVDEKGVVHDMVGRDAALFYTREDVPTGEPVLQVEALGGNGVQDVSFTLKAGEILGVAGLAGAGRTELTELLFAAKPRDSGSIHIHGKPGSITSPGDAIKKGLCLITEERKLTGLFLNQSLIDNTAIAEITKTGGFFVNPTAMKETAETYVSRLSTKAASVHQTVATLSGGNQQKVILSKWFHTRPDIYIFDEPTRGIDVGAKEDIYHLMIDLLKEGKAIIMISSDLPELTALSNRVLVMRKGRVNGELAGDAITETAVMELAI